MNLDNYVFGVGPTFENIISKETLNDLKATYNELNRMINYLQMAYYTNLGDGSNSDNPLINREIREIIEKKYFKELFNTFVRVFKPMNGGAYNINSTFLTIDETFAVRRFNGYYYCLPITAVKCNGDIIETKTPDQLVDENLKAYESSLLCMLAHVIEMMEYWLTKHKD